jgi:hypothetical protein
MPSLWFMGQRHEGARMITPFDPLDYLNPRDIPMLIRIGAVSLAWRTLLKWVRS